MRAYYGDNFRNNQGNLISPAQSTITHNFFTKQSHELRLTSPKDRRVRIVAGLFLQRQTSNPRDEYRIKDLAAAYSVTGQPGVFYLNSQDRVDKDQAAFTELSFDLTRKLTPSGCVISSTRIQVRYSSATTASPLQLRPGPVTGRKPITATSSGTSGENLCNGPPDPATQCALASTSTA